MGREALEGIHKKLKRAQEYTDSAAADAERVNDKSGAKEIRELSTKIEETIPKFDPDPKKR